MTPKINRRLQAGRTVVSTEDGEPGRIVRVAAFRRNGVDAWSYVVDTAYGREVWEVGEPPIKPEETTVRRRRGA